MSVVMRRLGVFALTLVMAGGWWYVGWFAIPALAFAFGLLRRARGAPREASLAALVATLALVARWALFPAFTRLLAQLGEIFPAPGVAVLIVGVLVSAALAYAGARVAIGLTGTPNG